MNQFCLLFCIWLVSLFPAKGETGDPPSFETLMNLAEQESKVNHAQAIDYAFKALNIAQKSNQILDMAYGYDLMGRLSKDMAEYRKAIHYFDLSLDIFLVEGNQVSIGQNYLNLAMIYEKINRQDSVRLCYYKALDHYRKAEAPDGLAMAYTGLAGYYLQEGKLDSAQIFIEKGLKMALLSESTKGLFNSYYTASNIFLQQRNYQKAMDYHRKALLLALRYGNREQESIARQGISRNHAAMLQFDSAYHYLSQSSAINDSLRRFEEIHQEIYAFAEHNVKEQFEREMKVEKSQRRLWLVIMGLCGMMILILSIFTRSMAARHKKIESINVQLNKYKSDMENNLQGRTCEQISVEQLILNLSDNLPDGAIFRFVFENESEGKMCFISSGWEKLTGQSIHDIEDAMFFFQNRIHPDDSQELLKALAHAIKNHTILDKTYRYYKENSEMRWFHIRATAIAGKDGLTCLDGFQMDETEEKNFEQELVSAKDKAEESDKLKSAFLANMSHEIRTPMNAVVGFSSLLTNTKLPPQRLTSYLEIIHGNCQRLLRLIDDIVDISKIEADQLNLRMETIQLSEIMKAVREHFDPIIHTGHPYVELWIDENLSDSELMLQTDVFWLKQIFVHLIDNALKFTEKGFVRCGQVFDRTDALHFNIMDTGVGIAPDNMESIFQSFRKLDQFSDGTGLGLSIVRRVLLQMGGSIWVESELGIGSTFHFTLPLNS